MSARLKEIDVDALSNFIRLIDGNNQMGAGEMAEQIKEWIQTHCVVQESQISRWDSLVYSIDQAQWCKHYEQHTGFEPLMDDFETGLEDFVSAAKKSVDWYENHTSDCLNRVGEMEIPGNGGQDE